MIWVTHVCHSYALIKPVVVVIKRQKKNHNGKYPKYLCLKNVNRHWSYQKADKQLNMHLKRAHFQCHGDPIMHIHIHTCIAYTVYKNAATNI